MTVHTKPRKPQYCKKHMVQQEKRKLKAFKGKKEPPQFRNETTDSDSPRSEEAGENDQWFSNEAPDRPVTTIEVAGLEEDYKCAICKTICTKPVKTPCNHYFCITCM